MEKNVCLEVFQYIAKAFVEVKPFLAFLLSVINYILFPTDAYIPATIGLGGAILLDIATKYYSYSVKYGGMKEAVKARELSSNLLWKGTYKKIVGYLVVMILAGLSYRVTMLQSVAVFLSTVTYSVMFLREAHSIVENLVDAGHEDLSWLLIFIKKKEKDVLEKEGITITDPVEKSKPKLTLVKESEAGGENYHERI